MLSPDEKNAIETEINRIVVMVNETSQEVTDESRLNSFKIKLNMHQMELHITRLF